MNDLFDRTDEELVALYAEGNNGAFDVLLKRHQVRTFNYIYYIVTVSYTHLTLPTN